MWQCEYRKTHSGFCEQEQATGRDVCYYHAKVVDGLIEADEAAAILDTPTISYS